MNSLKIHNKMLDIKTLTLFDPNRELDCKLDSLGKINVFCGKNNSGKTTVLKRLEVEANIEWLMHCIANPPDMISEDKFMELDSEVIELIEHDYQEMKEAMSLATKYLQSYRDELALPININVLHNKMSDYFSYTMNEIDDIIPVPREEQPNFSSLISTLRSSYKKSSVRFIEAKRNVRSTYDLQLDENGHILKYLFECKNCLSSDPKRQWYDNLNREFKELSGGYAFDLVMDKKIVSLFFEDAYDGSWYMADAMGLGLRDLLYMMAIASFPDTKVVLLEEPESHLHPELQRRLLSFFSEQEDKLFFITTHSNVFLDLTYVDSLFLVRRTAAGIGVENVKERAVIMSELGYLSSDNLNADVLIITEGKTDIPVLEEFFKKSEVHRCYHTHDIKFLFGGGISSLPDFNYDALIRNYNQIVVLVDGDENDESIKGKKRLREIISKSESMHLVELDGYGIENYFSNLAINKILVEHPNLFGDKFFSSNIDLKTKLKIKKDGALFRKIAQEMELKDILSSDLYLKLIIYVNDLCKTLPENKQK